MPLEWDDDTKFVPTKAEPGDQRAARDRAYLIVLVGQNVGEMYKITQPDTVIGRGQAADFQIIDEGMSRRHAAIRLVEGEMMLEDLGSRNGTTVNGQPIQRSVLRDGDKIQFGSTTILKFTYHDRLDETFQRQMYESALRDGLTKAFNKKYFLDRLEAEYRFARRHQVPLALVIFDLDHFKRVNDTFGHVAGDFVLATLARRVFESIRNEDVFARYGGEEFAIICRAIDMASAALFAERIRAAVEGCEFRFDSAPIPVTISLGVAAIPDTPATDALGLIAAADEALYAAKRQGRNRVVLASASPPPGSAGR